MSGKVMYLTYDKEKEIEVSVIVSFNTKGEMLPLYMKYLGETYSILSAVLKPTPYPPSDYMCKVEVYGVLKDVNLTYHPVEKVWTIRKQDI